MLTSISWQEFFLMISILLGCYYAITTLLFYSSEITKIFEQNMSIHSSREAKVSQKDSNEPNGLMGGVRYDQSSQQLVPREEVLNVDELSVVASQEVEDPLRIVDEIEERMKNDFVTIEGEIKSLAVIASLSRKADSIPLFKTLLSNYPQFIGTVFQGETSQLIYDSCKRGDQHYFSLEEINSWWSDHDDNA